MSFQALRWAFQQELSNTHAIVVLLVLANHASGTPARARPSIERLIAATASSRATVKRALHVLEAEGLIRRELSDLGRGKAVIFELLIPDDWLRENPVKAAVGVHPCDAERGSDRAPLNAERGSDRTPFNGKRGSDRAQKGFRQSPQPIENLYTPLTPQTTVSSGARQTGSLVWIDQGSDQFEAWSHEWDRIRGFPKKPWVSSHPDDRSRQGRWVESPFPPKPSDKPNEDRHDER